MYEIKRYNQSYNQKINDFIESIYIDEFGFEEHREIIKNQDNNEYIKQGGTFLLATDEDDNIIGTIAIMRNNDENVELKRLYVRKDYRGQGVSVALYDEILKVCRENNYRKIFLGTFEKMEKAIKFYIKRRI